MIKFLFAVVAFCSVQYVQAQATEKGKAYVEKYRRAAQNEMRRSGVPASIILAQGMLESGSGESELCLKSNNHFGIKCKSDWQGATVHHDDDAKGECFRVYNSAEESYADHSAFLKGRPHYAFLFRLDPTDYDGWAKGLKKAGYATNPKYPDLLRKMILDYDLQNETLYVLQQQQNDARDALALAEKYVNPLAPAHKELLYSTTAAAPKETAIQAMLEETPVVLSEIMYPKGVFINNNLRVIYAEEGTSLLALAAQHQISMKKLLEYNELAPTDILEKGQLIYLEKKKKLGTAEIHRVLPGETLRDIAQKEGLQLEALRQLNKIPVNAEPATGERIYLKQPQVKAPKLAVQAPSNA